MSPVGPGLTAAWVPTPLAGPQCPLGCQRSWGSSGAPQVQIGIPYQDRSGGRGGGAGRRSLGQVGEGA